MEVGHTHMEVDSIHSAIEHQIKKRNINIPLDYIDVVKSARLKPRPYKVKNDDLLDYHFFKNYEKSSTVRNIRPGRMVGDPCVTDIHQIRYKDENISMKLNHCDGSGYHYYISTQLDI